MVKEVFTTGLSSDEGQVVCNKILEQLDQIDATAHREDPPQVVNLDTEPTGSQLPVTPVTTIDGAALGTMVRAGVDNCAQSCKWDMREE